MSQPSKKSAMRNNLKFIADLTFLLLMVIYLIAIFLNFGKF